MTLEELNVVVTATTEDALTKLDRLADALRSLAETESGAESFRPKADTALLERATQSLTTRLTTLRAELDRAGQTAAAQRAWQALRARFDDAVRSGGDVSGVLADMAALCRESGVAFSGMADDVAKAGDGFAALTGDVSSSGAVVSGVIAGLNADCASLRAAMQLHGIVTIDTSNAIASIAAVSAALAGLVVAAAGAGVTLRRSAASPYTGGGGGGGSGSGSGGGGSSGGNSGGGTTVSTKDTWKDAYQAELRQLDHLKALGKLSYEDEIRRLQALQKRYKQYAEARMELEERVYEAAQDIRRRDADALDSLGEGLTTALRNRYQAAMDAETAALDKSRERWQAWRDENVAAIQSQLDALDALATAEDREAAEKDDQRRISDLREQIAFERDAYSRAMLERQLANAIADRDERLRDEARQDERAALETKRAQTETQAQAELDALDRQREAIEAYYAERLRAASLEAEAERLLMTDSQKKLLKLLQAFAPEYDALGRSFGERLLKGFTERVGDVGAWLARLTTGLDAAQSSLTALSANAGESTAPRAVTVNQHNVFTVPVESPAATSRRVAQANEALADELLGA